ELKILDLGPFKAHGAGQLELLPEDPLPGRAQKAMDHARLRTIRVSVGWKGTAAFAEARAEPRVARPGILGRLIYHLLPVRLSVFLSNTRRAFQDRVPESEVIGIAKASYAHFARLLAECLYVPWLSRERRSNLVRVENSEVAIRARERGKGLLILTGH